MKMVKAIAIVMVLTLTMVMATPVFAGLGRRESAISNYAVEVVSNSPRIIGYNVEGVELYIMYVNGVSVAECWYSPDTTNHNDLQEWRDMVVGQHLKWSFLRQNRKASILVESATTDDGVLLVSLWDKTNDIYVVGVPIYISAILNTLNL